MGLERDQIKQKLELPRLDYQAESRQTANKKELASSLDVVNRNRGFAYFDIPRFHSIASRLLA